MKDHDVNEKKMSENTLLNNLAVNNKKKISEELYIKLRDAILSGDLPEGYTFPNESALCKQLDVGRSTLREAFAALETHNLITRSKAGTYVNKEADIKNKMSFDMMMQHSTPEHVMQFRAIVEIGSAGSAAKRAKTNEIKVLEATLKSMKDNPEDSNILTVCDYDFHSQIVKMTGNELLYTAYNAVRTYYEEYVYKAFEKDVLEVSIKDHQKIIDAFKKKDAVKARAAMREHLSHIEPYVEADSDNLKKSPLNEIAIDE